MSSATNGDQGVAINAVTDLCLPKVDTNNLETAIIQAATIAKNQNPDLFFLSGPGDEGRVKANGYEVTTVVLNILRANGYNALRITVHPTLSAPFRYATDALILNDNDYDFYTSFPYPTATPKADLVGPSHGRGDVTDDLVPVGFNCGQQGAVIDDDNVTPPPRVPPISQPPVVTPPPVSSPPPVSTPAPLPTPVPGKTFTQSAVAAPAGYLQLSDQAADLNLTGTVSNGSYGLGKRRGWVLYTASGQLVGEGWGGHIPRVRGDVQFATPDVAAALEAASQ